MNSPTYFVENNADLLIDRLINDSNFRKQFLADREKVLIEMNILDGSKLFSVMKQLNVTALLINPSQAFSRTIRPI